MVQLPDGAIEWGGLTEDDCADGFEVWQKHRELYQWVRVVRGAVVSGAFSIERNLGGVISYYYVKHDEELFLDFSDKVLASMSFDRRSQLATHIAQTVVGKGLSATLRTDIQRFQKIRNAMAHKPFLLKPQTNTNGAINRLVPVVSIGKAETVLDGEFVTDVNGLIGGLITQTAQLGAIIADITGGEREGTAIFKFETGALDSSDVH